MEKIRNKHKGVFGVTECAWAIDEIIDWINAHDTRPRTGHTKKECDGETYYYCGDTLVASGSNPYCFICYGCPVCEKPWETPPSIEQELESGLKERKSHSINCKLSQGDGFRCFCGADRSCTRIFLPAAKWEELTKSAKNAVRINIKTDLATFHDIPVFSYSGDEIIFCTD